MPNGVLTKKLGPFPIGVWLVLGGVGGFVGYVLRRRGPSPTPTDEPAADDLGAMPVLPFGVTTPASFQFPQTFESPPPMPPAPVPPPLPPALPRGQTFEYMCSRWRYWRTKGSTIGSFLFSFNRKYGTTWTSQDVRRCG